MPSDAVIQGFFNILPPLAASFVTFALPYMIWKQGQQDKKLESVKQTGEANHALGNSAKGAQLKLTALALHTAVAFAERLASQPGAPAGDKDAAIAARISADEADKLFNDHERKQAIFDAQSKQNSQENL